MGSRKSKEKTNNVERTYYWRWAGWFECCLVFGQKRRRNHNFWSGRDSHALRHVAQLSGDSRNDGKRIPENWATASKRFGGRSDRSSGRESRKNGRWVYGNYRWRRHLLGKISDHRYWLEPGTGRKSGPGKR